MSAESRPHYHQFALSLLSLAILTATIYLGQNILVPLAMSGLIAVLLRPVERRLTQWGVHKVIAISLAVLLAIIVVAGITTLMSMQLSDLTDDLPKVRRNLSDLFRDMKQWVRREYNVSYREQDKYIKKAQAQTLDSLQSTDALGFITGPLGTLTLLPIYVFLLLYYRTMLLHFVVVLFAEKHTARVNEVLSEVKAVVQNYMVGLLIETACVAALNFIGLLILGVQYALLLSVMAAILNVIPYIGGLVATALTVLFLPALYAAWFKVRRPRIRPEHLGLEGSTTITSGANRLTGTVEVVEPLGAETDLMVNIGGQTVVAKVDGHAQVKVGDTVTLFCDQSRMHAFDMEKELAIGR